MKTIYQTGLDIESYVDGLTDGKGLEWMNAYLGGTTITQWKGDNYQTWPSWMVGKNTIHLSPGAVNGNTLVHEFGHIWDINTSTHGGCLYGVVNGVADQLNDFIGGNVFLRDLHFRWMNDSDNKPNFSKSQVCRNDGFLSCNFGWFSVEKCLKIQHCWLGSPNPSQNTGET